MQEIATSLDTPEGDPSLSDVPLCLQKYLNSIIDNGLFVTASGYTKEFEEETKKLFHELSNEEKIYAILQEFTNWTFIMPELYIPLIIKGYNDNNLIEALSEYDPYIRGALIKASLKKKAELESEEANFKLGISEICELPKALKEYELSLITPQIRALNQITEELLP